MTKLKTHHITLLGLLFLGALATMGQADVSQTGFYESNAGSILNIQNQKPGSGEYQYEQGMVALKERKKQTAISHFRSVSIANSNKVIYAMAQNQLRLLVGAVKPVLTSTSPRPVRKSSSSPVPAPRPSTNSYSERNSISGGNTGSGTGCYYNGHQLHVGPRGGCYYINSHGNKTYVDRSYCSGCN